MPDAWANAGHDRWLVRRLPALVRGSGFAIDGFRGRGFVGRGVDLLRAAGQIGDDTTAALKAEARRRVEAGAFFGHIADASLTAHKPP